ncbi:rho GTPase-activating protein 39-like [Egretta garzetta]|uniref:rho GTPase-activating protein 39-like n=1 Tax=Egretta garzetta TaxID=188379 RepID=UPI00163BC8C5|nr:rho GTPase-activating protein 39-like [Egretta garzetta]
MTVPVRLSTGSPGCRLRCCSPATVTPDPSKEPHASSRGCARGMQQDLPSPATSLGMAPAAMPSPGQAPGGASSDWVEIIEPRSQERMYVNLTTGECGWEPPPNLKVRQSDQKQWWELFDQNNNRFYYYNAITRQTVWHRPQGCDIVPLAQLQAMKRSSQPDCRGRQHWGSTGSDGRSTPIQAALLQEVEKSKGNCTAEKRKDPGRETPTHWQPLPGTKAAMLVKVNSLRQMQSSSNSSLQLQSVPEANSQKSLPKPAMYAQPQSTSQSPGAAKQMPTGETKQSMQIKKTENGGFCLVLKNGPPSQTPPRSQTGTPQPASPKYASPAPIYDEPSLESPIYDEPPVDMDTESISVSGMSPPRSPSNSLKKQLQPTKLLQHPGMQQQQAAKKHTSNPSSTEYSLAGREYIKQMVNVDQSSKLSHSAAATADASAKLPGHLTSKDSFKQSWRILEANVLKNMEAHHSRQNSLQTQEYPTGISHQDSGYSTGPSPSLRKRKGKRQGTGQGRPGSVGSSSELTALNDKLIAEMRAVVGRSAACRGSKASLDAQSLESGIPAESSKVRFQSDHLKKCISRSSRDDVSASNRSLYRQSLESRGSFPNDVAAPQDTVRQKRTFEKIDSLEKNVTSQTSLASSDATRHSSQPGTIELDSKQESSCQRGGHVGYNFPYSTLRKPISQSSMADWASKNLNMHTQGIFRRRISISNMLSWNGSSIKKPMLITSNRTIKKEACEMFKLVQSYMGDRQTRMDRNHVALVTVTKCWSMQGLRDELYIQLIRQTTDNTCYRSLAWGWELMAISLAFFSPSPKFQSYLEGYIYRHLDSDENIAQRIKELVDLKNKKNSKSRKKRKQNTEDEGLPISTYAKYCYRKLQKVAVTGGKKGRGGQTWLAWRGSLHALRYLEIPPTSSVSSAQFCVGLEIMLRQQDMYPGKKLPWVQTQLSQQVLALGGEQTEGIFRIPGDIDEVNALKLQVDQWRIPSGLSDPNIPASLLKLWYRELEEPVIPQQFYKECINNYENPDAAVAVVQLLPELNRLVLCYLIHFLQIFAQPSNVGRTKMDVNNLAMVMAPNCLRCQSDDPRVIFENTRKEMSFLRMLIVHLDTSFIKGLV